jgi:hypothetical protein
VGLASSWYLEDGILIYSVRAIFDVKKRTLFYRHSYLAGESPFLAEEGFYIWPKVGWMVEVRPNIGV